jgi:hypothetical protein
VKQEALIDGRNKVIEALSLALLVHRHDTFLTLSFLGLAILNLCFKEAHWKGTPCSESLPSIPHYRYALASPAPTHHVGIRKLDMTDFIALQALTHEIKPSCRSEGTKSS